MAGCVQAQRETWSYIKAVGLCAALISSLARQGRVRKRVLQPLHLGCKSVLKLRARTDDGKHQIKLGLTRCAYVSFLAYYLPIPCVWSRHLFYCCGFDQVQRRCRVLVSLQGVFYDFHGIIKSFSKEIMPETGFMPLIYQSSYNF